MTSLSGIIRYLFSFHIVTVMPMIADVRGFFWHTVWFFLGMAMRLCIIIGEHGFIFFEGWWHRTLSIDTNNVGVSRKSSDEAAPSGGVTSSVNFGTAGNGVSSGNRGHGGKPSLFERVSRGFRDLFSKPAAVVSGGAARVVKTFGVSTKVATVGLTVAAVALGGGAVAVVGSGFGTDNGYMQTIWVDGDDDDDCVDYIQAARKELGGGEVEVPESLVSSDGKAYKVGYVGSWEGRVGALRGLGLCGDVLEIANFYDTNGGHTDSAGFERIGDLYIVAVGEGPFVAKGQHATHVGDLLTLTFDDGTSIGAIIGDMKGRYGVSNPYDPSTFNTVITGTDPQGRPDTSCGWGHAYGDRCMFSSSGAMVPQAIR
jgi:hypothetical protein